MHDLQPNIKNNFFTKSENKNKSIPQDSVS